MIKNFSRIVLMCFCFQLIITPSASYGGGIIEWWKKEWEQRSKNKKNYKAAKKVIDNQWREHKKEHCVNSVASFFLALEKTRPYRFSPHKFAFRSIIGLAAIVSIIGALYGEELMLYISIKDKRFGTRSSGDQGNSDEKKESQEMEVTTYTAAVEISPKQSWENDYPEDAKACETILNSVMRTLAADCNVDAAIRSLSLASPDCKKHNGAFMADITKTQIACEKSNVIKEKKEKLKSEAKNQKNQQKLSSAIQAFNQQLANLNNQIKKITDRPREVVHVPKEASTSKKEGSTSKKDSKIPKTIAKPKVGDPKNNIPSGNGSGKSGTKGGMGNYNPDALIQMMQDVQVQYNDYRMPRKFDIFIEINLGDGVPPSERVKVKGKDNRVAGIRDLIREYFSLEVNSNVDSGAGIIGLLGDLQSGTLTYDGKNMTIDMKLSTGELMALGNIADEIKANQNYVNNYYKKLKNPTKYDLLQKSLFGNIQHKKIDKYNHNIRFKIPDSVLRQITGIEKHLAKTE